MTTLRRRLRRVLIVLLGLIAVAVGVLAAAFLDGGTAKATTSTCSQTNPSTGTYVDTVSIGDNLTTLTDAGGLLLVNGTGCTVGTSSTVTAIAPTSIVLSLGAGTTPTDVELILDQGTGSGEAPVWFPCSTVISGTTAGDLQVEGAVGSNLTAGRTTSPAQDVLDIGTTTPGKPTGPATACGAANVTATGYTSLFLVGGPGYSTTQNGKTTTQMPTLSAAGGPGVTGSPDVPVTLDGTQPGTTDTMVAGLQDDTFLTGAPGSEIDFSSVDPACTQATCSLAVNGTSGTAGGEPPGTGTLTVKGPSTSTTYTETLTGNGSNLSGPGQSSTTGVPADFTSLRGLSAGASSFYLPPPVANVTDDLLGNATLEASAGTYTVNTSGASNQIQAGAGTETFTVSGSNTTMLGGSDTDTFTVDGQNNTFEPGTPQNTSETESFYDDKAGNTVDFSNVGVSAGEPLAINASGNPQLIPGTSTNLANGQAAIGTTTYYTFRNNNSTLSASDFSTFKGAQSGDTSFLAGNAGGLVFNGQSSGNAAYFDGTSTGIVANLSGAVAHATGSIGPSTPLPSSSFTLGLGQVLVTDPGSSTSCSATTCDTVNDVSNLTGPGTGYSTFYGGAGPATYTFSAAGDYNTFEGGSGYDNFTASGNNNDFVAGSGGASIADTTSQQGAGAHNTVDFSDVPVGSAGGCTAPPCALKINVSGNGSTGTNYQAVLTGSTNQGIATYSFGGQNGADGPAITNLIGASGGDTTFTGGLGPYTYTGQGSGNTLDMSHYNAGTGAGTQSLSYDVVTSQASPFPQLNLDGQTETFSGITNLVGLSGGNTSFVGGNTGGYTFDGQGSGNTADFSAEGASTTLTVNVTAQQSVVGGTVKFEVPDGTVLCTASPVVTTTSSSSGQASCNSAANLPTGTQVLAIYAAPTGVAQNGSAATVQPSYTGTTTAAPTVTSAVTVGAAPLYTGESTTLSAKVTSGSSEVSGGTLSFSLAGANGTLCQVSNYGPGNETCTAPNGFPASGSVNIVADYLPASPSAYLASAKVTTSVVTDPPQTTTVVAPTSPTASCSDAAPGHELYDPSFGIGYSECEVTANVTLDTPSSSVAPLPAGTVTFRLVGAPGQAPRQLSCQVEDYDYLNNTASFATGQGLGTPTTKTGTATCYLVTNQSNFTIQASYQPSSAGTAAVSTGVAALTDPPDGSNGVGTVSATTTTLSDTTSNVPSGGSVTLTSTVSTGSSTNLPGGQVNFETADGVPLGNASVPSNAPSATVSYQVTPPRSGSNDVIAYYTPPSGSVAGSAATLSDTNAITVGDPGASSSSASSSVNNQVGVPINLSSTNYMTGTGTTLGPDEVQVAAAPSSPASCTGTSQPVYCDSLVGINSVVGSSSGSNVFVAGTASEIFGDHGTTGGDTIDFSNVGATSSAPLTVNATPGTDQTIPRDTARLGTSATYDFSNGNHVTNPGGNSDFAEFIGSNTGYTDFLAAPNAGDSYTAAASNNAIDFSAAAAGVTVNLASAPVTSCGATPGGAVAIAGGTDAISGLTNVTGSSMGGNTFCAGSTSSDTFTGAGNANTFVGGANYPDTFNISGNNDDFVAGTGGYSIAGTGGSSATLDFSKLSASLLVNAASNQAAGPPGYTAVAGGTTTYSFSPLASSQKAFQGSTGGSTYYAGTVNGDAYNGASGTSNLLSYANDTSGPLTIDADITHGSATLGAITQTFSRIGTFNGLPGGATDFVADGSGPFTFNGSGTGNTGDFTNVGSGVKADLRNNPATVVFPLTGGTTDYMRDISNVVGASTGGNYFYASTGNETFTDPGSAGGDTADFSGVPTSGSSPLAINVSGQPVSASGTTVQDQTAAVPGSYQYSLVSDGGSPEFTALVGAATGSTTFYAGAGTATLPASPGGYTFKGQGGNDALNLNNDGDPVNVDLATGTLNPNTAASTLDHLSGIANVTAPSGNSYFTGDANDDNFTANGNDDYFTVGTGGATITDQGAGNTVDLSNQGGALTVNSATGEATGVATTSFSLVPTTIKGATAGGTTFEAAAIADTYIGQGPAPTAGTDGNTLTFAGANSNGPLSFCTVGVAGVGCGGTLTTPSAAAPQSAKGTLGEALLGSAREPFSDIQTYDGLTVGNTNFVLGSEGNENLNATGTNNLADFSGSPNAISADLSTNTVCVSNCSSAPQVQDYLSGISTVYGSTKGGNLFTPADSSATFGDRNTAARSASLPGDAIDLTHVVASAGSPLVANTSATGYSTGVSNVASYTAAVTNGPTITFGPDTTRLFGSSTGFTRFVAPRSAVGYTFCAGNATPDSNAASCSTSPASNDTLDLSANTAGLTADLVGDTVTYAGVTGSDVIGASGNPSGFSAVVGSPTGANTYYGAGQGTTLSSSSSANTLSYSKVAGPVRVDLTHDTVTPGSGSADTFSFAGTPVIQGSQVGGDTYVVGTTPATLKSVSGAADSLDLSATPSGSSGDTVDLTAGTVSGPSIGTVRFTYGCSAGDLCPATITGSKYNDSLVVPASLATATAFTGNGGTDAIDLSHAAGPSTVTMPIGPGSGSVSALAKPLTFSGVQDVTGTSGGADTFMVGSGTESFTEPGAAGTLDLSAIGATKPSAGAQISAGESNGSSSGTVTSSGLGISDSFTNLGTTDAGTSGSNANAALIGTPGTDTFTQTSNGSFNFLGRGGGNILDLSGLSSTVQVTLRAAGTLGVDPPESCGSGTNDGTAKDTAGAVNDQFECMAQVITAGSQTFAPAPNQSVTLNGGGNGTLYLGGDRGGQGLSVWLPSGSSPGRVEGDGYNVTFTGMSTVDGSPSNDVFYPGTGNVTINGGGGTDGINYRPAPSPNSGSTWPAPTAAAQVNLSGAPYTVPGGPTLQPGTATGGSGGTLTLQSIANVLGTSQYNDVLVGGAGPGSLIGGAGNSRFVPAGGDDYIDGGTGSGTTLDLSALTGKTVLNLAVGTPQQTGDGLLTVVPGTIHTLVASNAGSQLFAGNGNVTLQGGPGNDTLSGGTGTQSLISGGGNDTLIAGSGTQTLNGGPSPVTFVPGSGADTLISSVPPGSGNTLSYASATSPAQVNLSPNQYTVPTGKPMAGTTVPGMTADGGDGATVNLAQADVTAVTGSPGADLIVTGPSGETINGDGGNDLIVAMAGNNTLNACAPNQTSCPASQTTFLMDGSGSNTINGGGAGTLDFSLAPAGVTVNLQSGQATGGFTGTQALTGILNAVGSNYADTLIAGPGGGTMTGLNATTANGSIGSDVLQAGPSGHTTLVSGGNGNDTFCAETSCAQAGTATAGGDTMTGGTGNDTFFAANGAVDTVNGGGGYNQGYFDANDIVTNVQQEL